MTSPPPWLVFADDWGRHPSSCQHLIRHVLPHRSVTWVNTIGTRPPRLDWGTVKRAAGKLKGWVFKSGEPGPRGPRVRATTPTHPPTLRSGFAQQPTIISPKMWPSFRSAFSRRLNRKLLLRALNPIVAAMPAPPVVVTTLPLVADLIGPLPVARWVYYCVDDFSVWPGYDGETMLRMEAELVPKVDAAVTVSETLQSKLAAMGRESLLLTHGVDLDFWSPTPHPVRASHSPTSPTRGEVGVAGVSVTVPVADRPTTPTSPLVGEVAGVSGANPAGGGYPIPPEFAGLEPPFVLFWGVIDRRTDVAFVRHLCEHLDRGTVVLVGPQEDPDPVLKSLPRLALRPPVPFARLPALAQSAAVLVMPYADLPATRAMQPLKLKEYLATGKPAVVRSLPSTTGWADAADVCDTPEAFTAAVRRRCAGGLPAEQGQARERLPAEGWAAKAAAFEKWVDGVKVG
jgi:glycosyltransferase involved in cell wall biosynthesis